MRLIASHKQKPLLIAFSASLLGGCASPSILDPKGQIGAETSKIFTNTLGAILVIVAPTIIAAIAFSWWFRSSNRKARYLPNWVFSGRIEILNWGFPTLVLLFLSGIIWVGSHQLDPYKPIASHAKPLELEVVSLDWKWLFIYPEQAVASVNELVVSIDVPLHFSLTSATVMNSFFVPQLGSMIAAMPNMVTQLYLKADHKGDYYGLSTQYSGDGFSGMHFLVHAVSNEEFEHWTERARSSSCVLNKSGYAALLHVSRDVSPFRYRSVMRGLFEKIAHGKLAPTEGAFNEGLTPQVTPEACAEKLQ